MMVAMHRWGGEDEKGFAIVVWLRGETAAAAAAANTLHFMTAVLLFLISVSKALTDYR